MGNVVQAMPYAKELGPPIPPPAPPRPPLPKLNVDYLGAIHPHQYLSAAFVFDSHGRLKAYTARGSAAQSLDTVDKFWEKIENHPEMTDEEIIAGYKESGAKYAIGDKESIKRDLPVKKLEQFLGKLEIVGTKFPATTFERMDKLGAFAFCSVLLLTSDKEGKQIKYEVTFEPTRGALMSLSIVPDKASSLNGQN